MSEDFENNIDNTQSKGTDEIVDDIPENVRNIGENNTQYSSVHIETTSSESSLMSIISFALGIFSVICCCTFVPSGISAAIGLVLGIISVRNDSDNKNFAIIGIILCSIGLAIFFIYWAVFIIAGSAGAIFEIPATMHSMTM